MAKTKTSSAVKQRYNEKAYDRLAITIPKGKKDAVAAFAERNGESINSLVNKLLMERMELSDSAWKRTDVADQEQEAKEA